METIQETIRSLLYYKGENFSLHNLYQAFDKKDYSCEDIDTLIEYVVETYEKDDGTFEISPGRYDLVYQFLVYKRARKTFSLCVEAPRCLKCQSEIFSTTRQLCGKTYCEFDYGRSS